MKNLVLLLAFLFLFGCGAKNPQELQSHPAAYDRFTVKNNYQEVFKKINDHILKCDNIPFYKETNIYSVLKQGEIHFYGDGRWSLIFVKVTENDDMSSDVEVFLAFDGSNFQKFLKTIKNGANGLSECPN